MRLLHFIYTQLTVFLLSTAVHGNWIFGDIFNNLKTHLKNRQTRGTGGTQFLRRAFQASTVVGNYLYIDGGEFSELNNGNVTYNYSTAILSIDLSQSWINSSVHIASTIKPDNCPCLNVPSLWYHQQEGLVYTGFTGWLSEFNTIQKILPIKLWTFKPDGLGNGVWTNVSNWTSTSTQLNRPSDSLQAFGGDIAWSLGGVDEPAIPPSGTYKSVMPGMIRFNMSSRMFENISSTECPYNGGAVADGDMHYIPSFGPGAIFVAMGGGVAQFDASLDFSMLAVFDPITGNWWNQSTTGAVPIPRINFCTAGISSTNNTYEIFVYGGWGGSDGVQAEQYDTINILTLPAFTWVSVEYNSQSPRYGHSCNAVGGSQILTIGGADADPQTSATANACSQGAFNTPDPNAQGLAIFDMTSLTWSSQYTAGAPPYEQSDLIKQIYSGQQAFSTNNNPEVAALLQVTHFSNAVQSPSSPSAPSATTTSSLLHPPHSSHSSAGAMAGGIGGGLALLAIIVGCILFCYKRKSRGVKRRGQRTVEIMGRGVNILPKQGGLWELSEDKGIQPEGPQEMFQDNALEIYQDNSRTKAERPLVELGG